MADTPLFYTSVVPLNRERHRALKLISPDKPYAFAAKTHMIPALVEEFGVAGRHLPIVFLPGATQLTPIFLVGLQPGRNSFVADDGTWTGTYLPAFMRRYPFIIGEPEGGEPIICIDEGSERLSNDSGERLFTDEGTDTPLLADRIKFANDYATAAKLTERLSSRIREYDLLRPISIEAKSNGQASAVVHGLFAIDEAKLAELSDDRFLQLRKDRLLGPIYAHLVSLAAVDKLGAPQAG